MVCHRRESPSLQSPTWLTKFWISSSATSAAHASFGMATIAMFKDSFHTSAIETTKSSVLVRDVCFAMTAASLTRRRVSVTAVKPRQACKILRRTSNPDFRVRPRCAHRESGQCFVEHWGRLQLTEDTSWGHCTGWMSKSQTDLTVTGVFSLLRVQKTQNVPHVSSKAREQRQDSPQTGVVHLTTPVYHVEHRHR